MRAKRLGIRRHDLEDAQQEIVLDVLDFRFDAAKSNGACERTALTSLIDRRLMTMLRAKRRYAQRVQSLWSPEYGRVLSADEEIEILMNVKRFAEVLMKINRERSQQ